MSPVSISRLLRPLLWLLWLVLLSVVMPVLLIVMTPVLLLVWAVGLPLTIASRDFRKHMDLTPLGMALWVPWLPLLTLSLSVPVLALAHAALLWLDSPAPSLLPLHLGTVVQQLHQQGLARLAELDLSRQDWAWLCIVSGVAGVSSNLVYAFIDIPWRLKQIGLVRALPRSTARSAAIGLAEFKGTARMTGADGRILLSPGQPAPPFYLEDETGRILVDPRGAKVRPRWTSGQSLSLNEIEAGIRDGDRVYVIGNVQPREIAPPGALGADALVVRPLEQALVSSPVARLLFPAGRAMSDRDAPNIFIVDRGREHDVVMRLRMALWDFCVIGAIYLAASLWLVQAAWPWLRSG